MPTPFVLRPFRPARWLPGAHAQTIAGRFLRGPAGVTYRRERLELPDGDFVDLDHATVRGAPAPAPGAPVALVVHGLEGGSGSSYVLESCRALAEVGIRAVALNFRSCSGEPNRLARFYHAGDTGDLAFALAHVAAAHPGVPLVAVGFSLGGNVLLKYLGERGEAVPLRAAVAVSVPFDLTAGAGQLDGTRTGRFYVRFFVRKLRRKFMGKRAMLAGYGDVERALRARTFREFDDAVTARLHGFRSAEHYWESSSSAAFLAGIRIPTLILHAVDDPFLPPSAIPRDAVRANPWLHAGFTAHGGHVGFVAGPPWAPEFWAEAEAARFLSERLRGAGMPHAAVEGRMTDGRDNETDER
ncbi:MAG TPA: alpha/beta fold hydrolase [Longimicrobiaceae bacterium]|nr:alpha/beta fold hydrolase [Longimicrobiaceae bacterium]